MAIGLFGGTFDPIHVGHLRIAEEVREHFNLESVYFVPASVQPLKVQMRGADGMDRMKMVKTAIRGNGFFKASSLEIGRGGVSYTIDTIRAFHRDHGDIYFLVGMDAFRDVGLWKNYEELFRYTNFVVMARPGYGRNVFPSAMKGNVQAINHDTWEHTSGKRIYLHDITQLDISSTRIRELVRAGKSIKYLVPGSVERYIGKRGLYTN